MRLVNPSHTGYRTPLGRHIPQMRPNPSAVCFLRIVMSPRLSTLITIGSPQRGSR